MIACSERLHLMWGGWFQIAAAESGDKAHEGAHHRWRIWRTGGRRASRPERGGVRRGHHDLRGGRAGGRRVLSRRQRGEWLQPAWLSVRQGIPLHVRAAQVDSLRKQSLNFRHGGILRVQYWRAVP